MADRDGHKMQVGTHSVPYMALLVLFALAFVWRMEGIAKWPIPFHPTLQYENALNTRALVFKFKGNSATPAEQAWMAGYQGRWKGLPLVECLTATVYWVNDREMPWVADLFTTMIWLISAGFFYDLARRHLHSMTGAFAATSFLLLHSFTVVLSRSFQHEAVNMLGFILAWWCVSRWDVVTGLKQSLLVTLFCGVVMLLKPGVAWIPWCFVLLAETVHRHGWRKALISPWIYVVPWMVLFPSVLWVKCIMTTEETHQWKWRLLFDLDWYQSTWLQVTSVIGWAPVVVLLLVTLRDIWLGNFRAIILLVGCLGYVAVFNYACMTHDYYLLMLFPVTALACGRLLTCHMNIWRMKFPHKYTASFRRQWRRWALQQSRNAALVNSACITVILANAGFFWHRAGFDYSPLLSASPYRPYEQQCQALGQQLGMGAKVIALTNDYAMPLRYFSGLHAQWWPTSLDLWYEGLAGGKVLPAKERLDKMLATERPRYFIITIEDEYQAQGDLVELLKQYREMPASLSGVRIFDLSR